MNHYKKKYLKYKLKYLELKKQKIQFGGDGSKKDFEEKQKNIIYNKLLNFCTSENNTKCSITNNLILVSNNNWDWFYIKKIFGKNEEIMEKYFNFRKNVVDDLIENIFTYFDCDDELCQLNYSGSVGADANLLSDYDLTIVNQNLKTSEIIQMFNSVIGEIFNCTPAEAFDTNLYGYSCIISNTSNFNNKLLWKLIPFDNMRYYLSLNELNYEQDNWALKRLITFLHNDGLKINNNNITTWLQIPENNIKEMSYLRRSELYIDKMNFFESLMEKYNDENLNKLDNINKEQIIKEMSDSLSYMNFYGDETYFTIGSFIHVVGTMFYYNNYDDSDKIKILTYQQLLHSMIENLAYFLHTMDKKQNDVLIGTKYLERFFNGYKLFLLKKNNVSLKVDELLNLLKKLKKYFRNRTDTEIINYIKETEPNSTIFIDVNLVKLNKIQLLENKLLGLLDSSDAKVLLLYNNNKYQFYIYALTTLIKSCISQDYTFIEIDNTNENDIVLSLKLN